MHSVVVGMTAIEDFKLALRWEQGTKQDNLRLACGKCLENLPNQFSRIHK